MITDYTKQSELFDMLMHKDTPITIIGTGAIGSWVCFILLKMGFTDITIYDFDTIEEHNIPNQLFQEKQINLEKVTAMEQIYQEFFHGDISKRLHIKSEKVTKNTFIKTDIIFCCVDSMAVRKELYETLFKFSMFTKLWIEGRISLYGAYIYTLVKNPKQLAEYEKTLYDDVEAEVSACGISQTALPAAINAASVMVMQMIDYFNQGEDILNKIEYSIPNFINFTDWWK